MKCQTYNSTPGLERYPVRERSAKWKAVHKRLLLEDSQYKTRFISYQIGLSAVICLMGLATTLLANIVFEIMVPIVLTAVVVYLALRQQHFMNRRVANYLQSNHGV